MATFMIQQDKDKKSKAYKGDWYVNKEKGY